MIAEMTLPPNHASGGRDFQNKPNAALPDGTRPQLSPDEAGAARVYSGGGYEVLNGHLREGGTVPPEIAAHHAALQSAMSKVGTLPEPVTVHRGMRLKPEQAAAFVARLKAESVGGKTVQLPGYTSTSTSPGAEKSFGSAVHVQIEARRGLDMMPHSKRPAEHELLLGHNERYEVAGIDDRGGGKYTVRLRQIV